MFAISTTILGLKTISSPEQETVYQTTDYGGGQWYYDPNSNGSINDDGTTVLALNGGVFRRIMSNSAVDFHWFTNANETTDVTALFQNVLDHFSTINLYKSITIDNVTITRPLIINCFNSAEIKSVTTGFVLTIKGINAELRNVKINNLIIRCASPGVTSSTTSGINIENVKSLTLTNYRVYGAYTALSAKNLIFSNIENVYGSCVVNGINFKQCVDVTVSGRLLGNKTLFMNGIQIDSGCDGIKVLELNTVGADKGCYVSNTLGGAANQPKSLLITNSDFGDGNFGIYIEAGLHISMNALNVVTCDSNGVYIKNAGVITLGNSQVTNNGLDGIYIVNSNDITINGVDVFLNSLNTTNTYNGISINGASNNISIIGGTIGAPAFASLNQSEKQKYGVYNNSSGIKIAVIYAMWETNITGNYLDIGKSMFVIDNNKIYNPNNTVLGFQGANSLSADTLQVFGTMKLQAIAPGIAALIEASLSGPLVQRIRNRSSDPTAYSELQVSNDTGLTAGLSIRSSGNAKPGLASLYANTRLELSASNGVSLQIATISGSPTTNNLSPGQAGLFFDNSTNRYAIYANSGGNIINISGGQVDISGTLVPNNVGGTYTASGTGNNTTIVIPHGLLGVNATSTPLVTARNLASSGITYIDIDSTNVYINHSSAPPAGTNNLKYSIIVKK